MARLTRRVRDQLRGEQTLERLLTGGLQLGEGASVSPRAYLDPGRPWLITIGDQSVISEFAIVMAHDPGPKNPVATRSGRVVIGRRVFVAPGAIILPGTRIGDDCVIDVRAVVSGEIPPGSFVSGNPGRIVGDVEDIAEQCRRAAANAPVWPNDSWNGDARRSREEIRAQRDALAAASDGYIRASAAQS
jgi:maltose O-acetyltransferase